jgi:hypothetical protein
MGFPIHPSIGILCLGFNVQPLFQGANALLPEGTVEVLCVGQTRNVNENLQISEAQGDFVE